MPQVSDSLGAERYVDQMSDESGEHLLDVECPLPIISGDRGPSRCPCRRGRGRSRCSCRRGRGRSSRRSRRGRSRSCRPARRGRGRSAPLPTQPRSLQNRRSRGSSTRGVGGARGHTQSGQCETAGQQRSAEHLRRLRVVFIVVFPFFRDQRVPVGRLRVDRSSTVGCDDVWYRRTGDDPKGLGHSLLTDTRGIVPATVRCASASADDGHAGAGGREHVLCHNRCPISPWLRHNSTRNEYQFAHHDGSPSIKKFAGSEVRQCLDFVFVRPSSLVKATIFGLRQRWMPSYSHDIFSLTASLNPMTRLTPTTSGDQSAILRLTTRNQPRQSRPSPAGRREGPPAGQRPWPGWWPNRGVVPIPGVMRCVRPRESRGHLGRHQRRRSCSIVWRIRARRIVGERYTAAYERTVAN